MLYVLFPNFELSPKQVEPDFMPEFKICQLLGIQTMLMDHTKLCNFKPDFLKTSIYGKGDVIYRGWMVTPKQYEYMYSILVRFGFTLITNPIAYKATHYFPSAYPLIKKYTVPTIWEKEPIDVRSLYSFVQKNDKCVLKDYVKSEKGTKFQYVDKTLSRDKFRNLIKDFKEYRRGSYNEGIVLKKYIIPKKYEDITGRIMKTNEWRAFFFKGVMISLNQNSLLDPNTTDEPSTYFIKNVAQNLFNVATFFSVDFMETRDKNWILLEVGDGQVSGLCQKQSLVNFYRTLQEIYNINKHENN